MVQNRFYSISLVLFTYSDSDYDCNVTIANTKMALIPIFAIELRRRNDNLHMWTSPKSDVNVSNGARRISYLVIQEHTCRDDRCSKATQERNWIAEQQHWDPD